MKRVIYVCDVCGREQESDGRPKDWREVYASLRREVADLSLCVREKRLILSPVVQDRPCVCSDKCEAQAFRTTADLIENGPQEKKSSPFD